MTADLTQATAARLARLYAKGKASPVETMKAVLARAEKLGLQINALCRIDAEASLATARGCPCLHGARRRSELCN